MQAVNEIAESIRGQIEERESEIAQLKGALDALGTTGRPLLAATTSEPAAPARARRRRQRGRQASPQTGSAAPRRRGRPPAGGKTRADEAVALVREHGPMTIPQLAKLMKIEPNYLYRALPKTELVKGDDKVWRLP